MSIETVHRQRVEPLESRHLLAHSIIRTAIDANSIQMLSSFAEPDIFIRADGGFGTIWQANNTGTGTAINMQLFTPAGNANGTFFTVAGNIPNSSLGVDFAVDAADNGDFAVAYKFQNSSSSTSHDDRIVLRRYDADGLTIGSAITVLDGDVNTTIGSVDVAVRSDGHIVVGWAESVTGGTTAIKFRRYNSAGSLQGSTVTVASGSFSSNQTLGSPRGVAVSPGGLVGFSDLLILARNYNGNLPADFARAFNRATNPIPTAKSSSLTVTRYSTFATQVITTIRPADPDRLAELV